jgi:hypothetical protein
MIEYSMLQVLRLPGRLTPAQAGEVLGFTETEVRILLKHGLLRALGRPPANGHKLVCALEVEQLSRNRDWLERASRCVYRHWAERNGKQRTSEVVANYCIASPAI